MNLLNTGLLFLSNINLHKSFPFNQCIILMNLSVQKKTFLILTILLTSICIIKTGIETLINHRHGEVELVNRHKILGAVLCFLCVISMITPIVSALPGNTPLTRQPEYNYSGQRRALILAQDACRLYRQNAAGPYGWCNRVHRTDK